MRRGPLRIAGPARAAPLLETLAAISTRSKTPQVPVLTPVMETQTADLVIVIRKGSGKVAQATIGGLPTNDLSIVGESTDGRTRVGVQQGRPPGGLSSGAQDTTPHPQVEVGAAADMFVVYQGHVDRSLERPSIWRYSAKDALESPAVPAVDKFRKAIEEYEKQQQAKS
jgi:hypothetical protein